MENKYNFKGFISFLKIFKDEQTCREFLEHLRWGGKPVCVNCGNSEKIYRLKSERTLKCSKCDRNFRVTNGTVFHSTHISLQNWFIAIYLFSSNKNGLSSCQLAKHLEITQPNAWYVLDRIRNVMDKSKQFDEILEGIIEADESYIGGKNKNRHWDKKFKYSQGRSVVDKKPVFGILQRNGMVKVWTLDKLDGVEMKTIIRTNVVKKSIVCTDEYRVYRGLKNKKRFKHYVIDHSKSQHKIDEFYHTNNIENFWNFIKRAVTGTYHKVDKIYLNKYAKEAAYRYNTRKMSDGIRFIELLKECVQTKLK